MYKAHVTGLKKITATKVGIFCKIHPRTKFQAHTMKGVNVVLISQVPLPPYLFYWSSNFPRVLQKCDNVFTFIKGYF